ncbi:MAG: DUF4357 domain-containing protein [Bacteroidia bacterium]|nr:DUF4357 domain-containing protein [Bacteroidia bacterium]
MVHNHNLVTYGERSFKLEYKNSDKVFFVIHKNDINSSGLKEVLTEKAYSSCLYFHIEPLAQQKIAYVGKTKQGFLRRDSDHKQKNNEWEFALVFSCKDMDTRLEFYESHFASHGVKNKQRPSSTNLQATTTQTENVRALEYLLQLFRFISNDSSKLNSEEKGRSNRSVGTNNKRKDNVSKITSEKIAGNGSVFFRVEGTKKEFKAIAEIYDEKTIKVLKGTTFSPTNRSKYKHIEEIHKDKSFWQKRGTALELLKDVIFSSKSAAASFVTGQQTNGNEFWQRKKS